MSHTQRKHSAGEKYHWITHRLGEELGEIVISRCHKINKLKKTGKMGEGNLLDEFGGRCSGDRGKWKRDKLRAGETTASHNYTCASSPIACNYLCCKICRHSTANDVSYFLRQRLFCHSKK